jgi:hypothetical protein
MHLEKRKSPDEAPEQGERSLPPKKRFKNFVSEQSQNPLEHGVARDATLLQPRLEQL